MMVAVAFTSLFQAKQFELFSEVLHIDLTGNTNKEARLFCTTVGKDSNGIFFTTVSYFFPNEQVWSFSWLLQDALLLLLTTQGLTKQKYLITDIDVVLIQQLDDALESFMTGIKHQRCRWHIINKGWSNQLKLPLSGFSKKKRAKKDKCKKRRNLNH